MNQRIRDLGTQAGLYVDLNGTPWPRAMSAEECEAAYKKFAELIVKECIEALRLVPYHSLDIDFDEEVIYQDAIRKHFGVES